MSLFSKSEESEGSGRMKFENEEFEVDLGVALETDMIVELTVLSVFVRTGGRMSFGSLNDSSDTCSEPKLSDLVSDQPASIPAAIWSINPSRGGTKGGVDFRCLAILGGFGGGVILV